MYQNGSGLNSNMYTNVTTINEQTISIREEQPHIEDQMEMLSKNSGKESTKATGKLQDNINSLISNIIDAKEESANGTEEAEDNLDSLISSILEDKDKIEIHDSSDLEKVNTTIIGKHIFSLSHIK